MRGIKIIIALFCFTLIACKQESAVEIVEKSLAYHGGMEAWKATESFTYQKEEWLYFENDSLESYTDRTYTHPLTEDLPIKMSWTQDSLTRTVQRDSKGFSANFNVNDQQAKAFNSALLAAPYTLCQPYKLLNDKDLLQRLDDDQLEDTPVYTVEIQYYNEDGSLANNWKYYFNKENYRMEGALVKHGSTYAYVRNQEFETTTGFSFNAKRISYRVDSLRNIQYVRGRYLYKYQ